MLILRSPAEKKQTTAEHLQNVSVTIRAEGPWSAGEGSGVVFTRKDTKGNLVNFIWTAAHVVDNLRTERKVLVNGSPKTLVEFKDPMVVKEIRQDGENRRSLADGRRSIKVFGVRGRARSCATSSP